jgi:hypothetical protein
MIRTLVALIFGALTLLPLPGHAQNSRFKGWDAVARELSIRLAPPGESLDLDQFIPADNLEDLVGTWYRFGDEHAFQNGTPNAVNMVIWRVILSGFAAGVAETCFEPYLDFNARFTQTVKTLCAWPAPEAKTEAVLMDFWTGVMGYDAPEAEYVAWRDFFLTSSYRDRKAYDTIEAMTLAITMNPFFLLHR